MKKTSKPDPATAAMTDRQMLESIQETLANLLDTFRTMNATIGIFIGDAQSFNRRMSAVEARIAELEQRHETPHPPDDLG